MERPGGIPRHRPRAFTLIELLVAVGVIAALVGLLLPALASARRSAEAAVCRSNLRQIATASTLYAEQFDGASPALGLPWGATPFWANVVRAETGDEPSDIVYRQRSVLVCPAADRALPADMTRTYAVNVTGHAGRAGDVSDFDSEQAHIRLWAVQRPASTPWYIDSDTAPISGAAPPPTRTLGTIDFRDPEHVPARLGLFHRAAGPAFHLTRFDTSVDIAAEPHPDWLDPLP